MVYLSNLKLLMRIMTKMPTAVIQVKSKENFLYILATFIICSSEAIEHKQNAKAIVWAKHDVGYELHIARFLFSTKRWKETC